MPEFLRIKGLDICRGEESIRLRGVNYGNWMLLEHYMLGLNWIDCRIRAEFARVLGKEAYTAFWDTYMDAYVREGDFQFLEACGFNLVRLPFSYHHFEDDLRPGEFLEEGFRHFDKVIGLCRAHGMYMLPVIYSVPGAQARDHNAESLYGESFFWDMKAHQERLYALWKEIARRYRSEPVIMGYELLEEPVTDNIDMLNHVLQSCIRAVRSVDRNHILVVQSNMWGQDVSSLRDELFQDPQVMPTMHHYHQVYEHFKQLKEYPGTHDGIHYGRKELLALQNGHFDQERIPRPVLVGEFGMNFHLHNNGALMAMLDDIVASFEERGFHWTLWNYKDLDAMSLVYPRAATPWKRFLASPAVEPFVKECSDAGNAFAAQIQQMAAGKGLEKDWVEYMPYHVGQVLQRLMLSNELNALKKYSRETLVEMAESFAFENCEVRTAAVELLKKYTLR